MVRFICGFRKCDICVFFNGIFIFVCFSFLFYCLKYYLYFCLVVVIIWFLKEEVIKYYMCIIVGSVCIFGRSVVVVFIGLKVFVGLDMYFYFKRLII